MSTIIEVVTFQEKKELWQWDTGRQIKIEPEENAIVDEVHFSNAYSKDALVVNPQVNTQGDIVADIPNILLWQVFPINVYVVMDFPNGKGTIYEEKLKINPRKKPSDYVYTETEILNYLDLEKRIKALEENGTGGGISKETDPTVPQWAKEPTKPSYTAEEVGAPTKEEFDEFILKKADKSYVVSVFEELKKLYAQQLNEMDEQIFKNAEETSKLSEDIADLKYIPIDITKLSNDVGTVEIGTVVNAVNLTWTLNKEPESQKLDGTAVDVSSRSKMLEDLAISTNKTFSLEVTDERDAKDNASTSISFVNGVYYGVCQADDECTSEAILALTRKLQSSKGITFTVNAGAEQHIVFAMPSRYGTPNFNVGGFDGGFAKVSTFEFTNASGYTESYDVWVSDNSGLGDTTVKVS